MNDNLPIQITGLLTAATPGDDGLLLRELQHRHANDVSIIVAAVRVCARRMGRGSPQGLMLLGLAHTLQAIGEVNSILAGSAADGIEDLAPVLEMLCDAAGRRGPARIRIAVEAQTVYMRMFVSRRLALVVNELVLNAVKHGYPDGSAGVVTVRLADDGGATYLSVSSDGVLKGWGRSGGQGVRLVDELVSRLGGEVMRSNAPRGPRTDIIFPSLAVPQLEEPF